MKKLLLPLFAAFMLVMPDLTHAAEQNKFSSVAITISPPTPARGPIVKSITFFDITGKRVGYATVGRNRDLIVQPLHAFHQMPLQPINLDRVLKNSKSGLVVKGTQADAFIVTNSAGRFVESWVPQITPSKKVPGTVDFATLRLVNPVPGASTSYNVDILNAALNRMSGLQFSKR